MESMVEAAIEIPIRPGVFMIDPGALRLVLMELVHAQQRSGDGLSTSLRVRIHCFSFRGVRRFCLFVALLNV